ncbi:MAG: hypothetical protein MJZ83_09605 [Bacteroidaceae bacterium]|nr:hypothetical protein [Bacteroidaceae bacterium]
MKTFYILVTISVSLIVGGFLIPPTGIIDGSVLSAVGELLAFAVVAQIPDIVQMARNGKSIKLQKGDFSAEIGASE